MAVKNFIQTIWSKHIQDDLELACKLVDNCLREYEGDCKYARTVKILGVGEPTIGTYDGNDINIEEMSDKGQLLTIDQQRYFAFYVDDVDQAQSVPGLAKKFREKAVHGLAKERDTYVAGLIAKAGEKNADLEDADKLDANANVTEVTGVGEGQLPTPEAILDAVDEAIVALRERNFDEDGVIEVTPAVYNKLKRILIDLSTNNPEYIKTGKVGIYDSFSVIVSNNMKVEGNDTFCDIRGKKAIAFAGQINEVEALRAEKKFKDIIRGLDTFGAKVIDRERIQVLKVSKGAA